MNFARRNQWITDFEILNKFFLTRLKRNYPFDHLLHFAIQQLVTSPQMWAIKDLAVKLGISQKHLISMFSNKVGLAPKAFSRISKFQKVIHQLESIKRIEWTWIATDCGYYDQSHFIKEFSEFSGVNPSEYLTQRGEYINYLPVTGF